jgi:hypothetical protein
MTPFEGGNVGRLGDYRGTHLPISSRARLRQGRKVELVSVPDIQHYRIVPERYQKIHKEPRVLYHVLESALLRNRSSWESTTLINN